MTTLDVNGAQLFVQEVGVGPVALVLHGGLGIEQFLVTIGAKCDDPPILKLRDPSSLGLVTKPGSG